MNPSFGPVNAHLIGDTLKLVVARGMSIAKAGRQDMRVFAKADSKGEFTDRFTDMDTGVEDSVCRWLHERYPTFGILGEEGGFAYPCIHAEHKIYWTIDPIDGTKAYIRLQSHGIGTQVALVCDGAVIAACIGDVMTGEMYYFRPGSEKVHRLPDRVLLSINAERPLADQILLSHEMPSEHSSLAAVLIAAANQKKFFKGYQIMDGSIATFMARLWKREVGAALLAPGVITPWDEAPIVGMSKKLGFAFFRLDTLENANLYDPIIMTEKYVRDFSVLVVHQSRIGELRMILRKI